MFTFALFFQSESIEFVFFSNFYQKLRFLKIHSKFGEKGKESRKYSVQVKVGAKLSRLLEMEKALTRNKNVHMNRSNVHTYRSFSSSLPPLN